MGGKLPELSMFTDTFFLCFFSVFVYLSHYISKLIICFLVLSIVFLVLSILFLVLSIVFLIFIDQNIGL